MNKEEILAMKAGEELDELIERDIFDWKPKFKHGDVQEFYRSDFLPYSTNISSAWQVVEKITKELDYPFYLTYCKSIHEEDKQDWRATFALFVKGLIHVYNDGKTAPEAICKAALLTKLKKKL